MKKALLVILSLIIILSPVALIATAIFAIPSQYTEAYVGALNEKVDRLMSIEEEKIVVIGGSSVAFALDSALMEKELGKPVVNFGLYAALGTKLMLDLSRDGIKDGDIVILAPELDAQTLSLFFSTENTLNAVDDDKSLLLDIPSEHWLGLIGGSWRFAVDKLSRYIEGEKKPEDIYAADNFNKHGDIKAGLRENNKMPGYFDRSKLIDLKPEIVDSEFVEYVNEYIAYCEEVGATVYFTWCPINSAGLTKDTDDKKLEKFSRFMQDSIDCDFIGLKNKNGYVDNLNFDAIGSPIIDRAYFYDSNFHLNDAGVTLYTVNLINSYYLATGDFESYCDVEIPEPPELPDFNIVYTEIDENEKYFTYTVDNTGAYITGLTDEGKTMKELTLPVGIGNYIVSGISAGAFKGGVCTSLTIPEDSMCQLIGNGAFAGSSIVALYIRQEYSPNAWGIITPYDFADTARGFKIYVSDVELYKGGYEWGNVPNLDSLLAPLPD